MAPTYGLTPVGFAPAAAGDAAPGRGPRRMIGWRCAKSGARPSLGTGVPKARATRGSVVGAASTTPAPQPGIVGVGSRGSTIRHATDNDAALPTPRAQIR